MLNQKNKHKYSKGIIGKKWEWPLIVVLKTEFQLNTI